MAFGRNVSPAPIRIAMLGAWRDKVRQPTFDLRLSYGEIVDTGFFANPKRKILPFLPRLVWRSLMNMRTKGNALSIGLLKGCLDKGVDVWLAAAAERLIEEDGRIAGLEVARAGGRETVAAGKGVILASGGFEWDEEMMARHFPGPVEWTASPATNSGDGQRMAAAVGAQLDHMDQALIMGTTPVTYEGRLQGQPAADYFLPHSMIVNRHGRRFVNEKQMNIGLAFAERDPATGRPLHLPAWRIYDSQFAPEISPCHAEQGGGGQSLRGRDAGGSWPG